MRRNIGFITIIAAVFATTGCVTGYIDRDTLKEEIKQEILAELRNQETPSLSALAVLEDERSRMKEEREREILAAIQKYEQTRSEAQTSGSVRVEPQRQTEVGSVEGMFLRAGAPLPECRVKLVRVIRSNNLGAIFNILQEGTEYETVTDVEGKYRFDNIPVGEYGIKWQLPQDTGWIRRLSDKPDAIVLKSETTLLKSIETNRRLVPR